MVPRPDKWVPDLREAKYHACGARGWEVRCGQIKADSTYSHLNITALLL